MSDIRRHAMRVRDPLALKEFLAIHDLNEFDRGVDSMETGAALLEIARRAGVRGLTMADNVHDTLPIIAEIAYLRKYH